jgi:hypothetical protein
VPSTLFSQQRPLPEAATAAAESDTLGTTDPAATPREIMKNSLAESHSSIDSAELLFARDLANGRTGMITSWNDLTPRQRSGYQRAACIAGHTYQLSTDRVVRADTGTAAGSGDHRERPRMPVDGPPDHGSAAA